MRFGEAEEAFREAIRLDPAIAGAHNGLGMVLRGKRRREEAMEAFREAIRLDPDLMSARENLSDLVRAGDRPSWLRRRRPDRS
jgi:Flp pilus assembly protein TadD